MTEHTKNKGDGKDRKRLMEQIGMGQKYGGELSKALPAGQTTRHHVYKVPDS